MLVKQMQAKARLYVILINKLFETLTVVTYFEKVWLEI